MKILTNKRRERRDKAKTFKIIDIKTWALLFQMKKHKKITFFENALKKK